LLKTLGLRAVNMENSIYGLHFPAHQGHSEKRWQERHAVIE